MQRLKAVIAIVISFSLGAVFLYSGWVKLYPLIETFEFTFVESGVANWYTAPVIARLLIGLELFTGVLLVMCYNLRRFTLPVAIGMLLFFILYLAAQILSSGNAGNCGCFGEAIRMTPLQAIVKNVVMIALALALYLLPAGWKLARNRAFLLLMAIPAFAFPFIVNPIDYAYTSNNLNEKVNYPLELELLYAPEGDTDVQVPSVELRKGRHVVAFLSLTCGHCRVAARKLSLIKNENPSIPVYFVLNGEELDYADFLAETGASNIPSSFCAGKPFVQLASTSLPRIYYLDNGMVVKKVDYFELNQYAIERWLVTGEPGL